ncbi:NAD-glutamate dehydrogenase [Williamsia serinedens]|uniref:Glutamate dehydrogenase n=1 Tax=Williamsia serinedens TaxID=391736 RepID=A0ABT1GV86_9NOCA|nr:NAD-glutamate dehydrogenase domain-containing protein [Williamsia serinedens]MCP2158894.1 glutamate dehydrogenase [Williamsia serinedens]
MVSPAEVARSYDARASRRAESSTRFDADRVRAHLAVAQTRARGEVLVDTAEIPGGGLAVLAVADDQPLLVEAAVGAVERAGFTVGRVDHPILRVDRDDTGAITGVTADDGSAGDGGTRESWMCLEVDGADTDDAAALRAATETVIARVVAVHADAEAMWSVVDEAIEALDGEERDLLVWLRDRHFHPIGLVAATGDDWDRGLGVFADTDLPRPPFVADAGVSVGRMHLPAGVHRTEYPTVVTIGTGRRRDAVVGVFSTAGVTADVTTVPVVREIVATTLRHAGTDADAYSGATMIELLQNHPRTDLFSADPELLARDLSDALEAVTAREVRVFLRADPRSAIVSAQIHLPRDRYTTRLRATMQDHLARRLGGRDAEYSARITDAPLAAIHVLMRTETVEDITPAAPGTVTDLDGDLRSAIQADLAEAARSWDEQLCAVATSDDTDLDASTAAAYAAVLSQAYKDQREPRTALADAAVLSALEPGGFDVRLARHADIEHRWTFDLYLCGRSASLTAVLPMIQSLGVEVLDEQPLSVTRPDGIDCWIYEFTLQPAGGVSLPADAGDDLGHRFTDAFSHLWSGIAEVDEFNELVIRTRLDWRSIVMLRAYAHYLRQCGFAYSSRRIASVLGDHAELAEALIDVVETSFHPDRADDAARDAALDRVARLSGDVMSLDADRIVSAFVDLVRATVRTNFFTEGVLRRSLAIKLLPEAIPQAPQPRPHREIYVYSPRVEGVHLRFGAVARGGIRWSDRAEDFRTEILGLVKAQAVKNAVIVPVGAKGGFVVRRPPVPTGDAATDREATRAAGVACYREFISALLDLTDDVAPDGGVRPAPGLVRRDGDDTYLVVAADKGTAAFSDIANEVAADHGFWLGDAFASGGSVGYDHKAMGITARGAWESVRRHFLELDLDIDVDDFTVVGVGDMSGDVFGNGMLLSDHIGLVAAFDHRHVFVDPTPDRARATEQRRRLFAMPRSSWADYDTDAISEGGGVWSRETKAIPISAPMRAALGIDDGVESLSPPELITAILCAPVDLLWNGGIGTYVKASTESHADVGDKANDAIRVDAPQVRARVIGEGGNLGVTERGRVEFDLHGGRINSDALDNSAGVDCSDHEVNIKILLDAAVAAGDLDAFERNELLASMTDEVARLVLGDNIAQNTALGIARSQSAPMAEVHVRLLRHLAREHGVDLELEVLPTARTLTRRGPDRDRVGLTSPELATTMAHVKLAVKSELLHGDLPDNDVFEQRLARYFPVPLRERFADGIRRHRLRREIVATTLVNDVVDCAGPEHVFSLTEGSGASETDAVRAFVVVSEIFGLDALWRDVVDAQAPAAAVDAMVIRWRRLLFRASRWMLATRPQPLAVSAEVTRYGQRVANLLPQVDGWLGDRSRHEIDAVAAELTEFGASGPVVAAAAGCLHWFCLLDIVDAAEIADRDEREVGELYFAIMEYLGVEQLLSAVSDLDSGDRWQSLARLALRDDLFAVMRSITLTVLELGEPDESAAEKIEEWRMHTATRLTRAQATLEEIDASGHHDLATLSVAARALRSMIR